jgi:platelet-activating factor acetylhydrolase
VKQRADDVGKSLDILTLLNEGAEIRNMMEGSYDFKKFKGRLDVSTAAVMGHSFGGATTVQTLSVDSRFKWVTSAFPLLPLTLLLSLPLSSPFFFPYPPSPSLRCGIALDTWMIPIASEIYSSNASISQPLYFINSYAFQWRENMRRMVSMEKPVGGNGQSPCRIMTLK